MASSKVPPISNVVPQDWNSVLRFSRDVQKYMSSLSNTESTEYFSEVHISGLTASHLIATDSSKKLVSSDLSTWLSGTVNQITVTDDGDGTSTLSIPQDLDDHTDWICGTLKVWDEDENILVFANSTEFYVTHTSDIPVATGMSMGLLLTLTYNLD